MESYINMEKTKEFLSEATRLVGTDREKDYGDKVENHKNIARLWSVILQKEITADQVYQCMIAVKLGRLIHSPKHEDSAIDICGYGALLGESDGKS